MKHDGPWWAERDPRVPKCCVRVDEEPSWTLEVHTTGSFTFQSQSKRRLSLVYFLVSDVSKLILDP